MKRDVEVDDQGLGQQLLVVLFDFMQQRRRDAMEA